MSASEVQPPQSYRKEEVQEILHLAIARKTEVEELSRTQLWEIAAELDIDADVLQVAENDWLLQKQRQEKKMNLINIVKDNLNEKLSATLSLIPSLWC
ncbi:hypothetical protein CWATWH0402_3087 [Crocosphaera watsonii WH 0402]|uniref:Uncharacterized protein n=1 Tax=Crocosphaera watsonii WH 0402 TaxID=1284629 RepID=T2JN18_CROWT|nr:hypothetical protein [Crocosphaera watsonii]CCQ67278.1 hypothetical protein CWATWH0402_3087 [Crocosphaera watsonii WH 0402]